MAEQDELLFKYLLIIKKPDVPPEPADASAIIPASSLEIEKQPEFKWVKDHLKRKDLWGKIMLDTEYDTAALKQHFNSKTDEERVEIFKLGISCLIHYTQINITGPDFDKETEEFLNGESFQEIDYRKLLIVNNEEVNINSKYPALLATAKVVFEWCMINTIVNIWWYWRSLYVHQQMLDEMSPTLLTDADRLHKALQDNNYNLSETAKLSLDIEIAQLYLVFRKISQARDHIAHASAATGCAYKYVGVMGKRTWHQDREIPQLAVKVQIDPSLQSPDSQTTQSNLPRIVALNDEVRLNAIKFSGDQPRHVSLHNIAQKLLLTIVKEMLISKPPGDLVFEELYPLLEVLLNQRSTCYGVRLVALMLRCKLEAKEQRTAERAMLQYEELMKCYKEPHPNALTRVVDVFGTGMISFWKTEIDYAELSLKLGLVKQALDIYLKVKCWEEVITCYNLLNMRHKATEIIKQQLEEKPTPKLWCLLGDATDDESCYEKAWELSRKRSHRAQRHWGNFLFTRDRYVDCLPHYEKSVSINPLQPKIWFRLGFAAMQVEKWQLAATAFRRHTTLEPDVFEAWNNLAQAYLKTGNKRGAHQALIEALKCNFDNWMIWENLLVISSEIGHYADMIRSYHKLLEIKDRFSDPKMLTILVEAVSGIKIVNDHEGQPSTRHLQKTRELIGRIVSMQPGNGFVWELYSILAPGVVLKAQRLLRAFRAYTQGVEWFKSSPLSDKTLRVCLKLVEVGLSEEIHAKDATLNSIKLSLTSTCSALKKEAEKKPSTVELLRQVELGLDQILVKVRAGFEL